MMILGSASPWEDKSMTTGETKMKVCWLWAKHVERLLLCDQKVREHGKSTLRARMGRERYANEFLAGIHPHL